MMNTFVSSPVLAAPSVMARTYRQTTRSGVPGKGQYASRTFKVEQGRACWAVSVVGQTAICPTKITVSNPLEKYPAWRDPEYRHAYLVASVEQGLAWQIRVNRKARGWSQNQLAQRLGTRQSAVSRLEDPTYGAHSLDTLVSIANVFDCALSVRFISYPELARNSEDLSPEALYAAPYSDDANKPVQA